VNNKASHNVIWTVAGMAGVREFQTTL